MHDNAGRTPSNEQSLVGHSGDKSKRAIHICRHHLVVASTEHAVALRMGLRTVQRPPTKTLNVKPTGLTILDAAW
jgi:hypothetical protein